MVRALTPPTLALPARPAPTFPVTCHCFLCSPSLRPDRGRLVLRRLRDMKPYKAVLREARAPSAATLNAATARAMLLATAVTLASLGTVRVRDLCYICDA